MDTFSQSLATYIGAANSTERHEIAICKPLKLGLIQLIYIAIWQYPMNG